tara:strand:- start:85 stop:708 length:624 start_codon:yes stop_codon:yes gene_type:complete
MNYRNGIFISFECPEASGKSTQIKLLKKYFIKNRLKFVVTREPGGTQISEKLRKIILDNKIKITNKEEILLLMASRLNHINEIIKPALSKNKIVISDRFADSTFVYQGYLNNFGLKKTIELHKNILENFLPKKTFLFTLPPNVIKNRLKKRSASNKYDKLNIEFHKKIISGYKRISTNNKRFILIDATLPINDIHNKIIKKIDSLIK